MNSKADVAAAAQAELEWEDATICALEAIAEADRSDAQAIFEGQSYLASLLHHRGVEPLEAARQILAAATPAD